MSESNRGRYKKKMQGAVATVTGSVYQVKLLMWYLLYFHEKKEKFEMSSEWIKAGQLDDIVLLHGLLEEGKPQEATFMQLKYRKNGDPITRKNLLNFNGFKKTKDDFALGKYLQSFCKIKDYEFLAKKKIKSIVIVTNSDLHSDIGKYFDKVEKENILDIPDSSVYRLRANTKFTEDIKENLRKTPAARVLALKIFERHCQQKQKRDSINALDFRSPEFKFYKKFLSKHVLQPHSEKPSYLKFKKSFIDGSYKNDNIDYSGVITAFKVFINEKFGDELDSIEFKASGEFCDFISEEIGLIQPEEIPFDFEEADIDEFMKMLRIFKTPDEMEISEHIKQKLSSRFIHQAEKHLAHALLFHKMMSWYRKPDAKYLTMEESENWLQDMKRFLVDCRNEAYFVSKELSENMTKL